MAQIVELKTRQYREGVRDAMRAYLEVSGQAKGKLDQRALLVLAGMTDSLTVRIHRLLNPDSAPKRGDKK